MADRYDQLADELVGGAQEEFVAELTERMAAQLEADVSNADVYRVSVAAARAEAMGVWAKYKGKVSAKAAAAFTEALSDVDEEAVTALQAGHGDALKGLSAEGVKNAIAVASDQMARLISMQNTALANTAADAYYATVADAVTRLQMGEGRNAVMERAYAKLADAGIETVDYKSGCKTLIDAAVRRHVVTQQSQCRASLLDARMDEWGHDLVYVSAHYGARPSHSAWQGKVYSRSGKDKRYASLSAATGYGTAGGLCGCNCRHTYSPYVEGVSQLPSTDWSAQEKLTGMTSDAYYAATQKQRAYERQIRKVKREIATGQAHGQDMASERAYLGALQAKQRAHVKANHLTRDYAREKAYGVKQQPTALRTGQSGQSLTAFSKSDAFKTAAKAAGVTQADALKALKSQVGGLGVSFQSLTPTRQLLALKLALRARKMAAPAVGRKKINGVGVFKFRGEAQGAHFDTKAELAAVNPNYATGEKRWRWNCQRCTVAYEARRRGFDVVAMPCIEGSDDVAKHWREYFTGTQYERCTHGSGLKEAKSKLTAWGPGARAIVYVVWAGGKGAHVFSAENVAGKVVFCDPQSGSQDCSDHFQRVKHGETRIMRVDNAEFSKWIKGCFRDA